MTDYSPFSRTYREPSAPMELARTLWMMRSPTGGEITAAIYNVLTGRELRVRRGADDLLESRLSRSGDAVLLQRAEEIRTLLDGKGWTPGQVQAPPSV